MNNKLKILRIAIPTINDGVLRNSSRRIFSHRLKLSPTLKEGVILKRYSKINLVLHHSLYFFPHYFL